MSHASWLGRAPLARAAKYLYTHNPFYLIGTCLVLLGLQQSLGGEPHLIASGLLVALLAGYTLLLAAVGVFLIRVGRIWDDARTILLLIVLLFFMLSTSLDVLVLFHPLPGTLLLAVGLVFSVAISESVLRLLRIRLAARYRGPYYLMLTLLFGYPVALTWLLFYANYAWVAGALYAFNGLFGLALVTLLPAAGTAAEHEPANGTPWRWPYFPWSLFVFLTLGAALRSYWLSIAFEHTEGQETAFRAYFLAPLVFAWGALLLQMGQTRRIPAATAAGMSLPLVAIWISFPGAAHNLVEAALRDQLASAAGSPAQFALVAGVAFYLWAWQRGVRLAEFGWIAAWCGLALVGRATSDSATLEPQPLAGAGLIAVLLWYGWLSGSTPRLALAAALALAAWPALAPAANSAQSFWMWHAPVLTGGGLLLVMDDAAARWGRRAAFRLIPAFSWLAAAAYPWFWPQLPDAAGLAYLALLALLAVGFWWRDPDEQQLAAVALTLGAGGAAHARQAYLLLDGTLLARGLPWLAAGGMIVLVGLAISLAKMHASRVGPGWLRAVNLWLRTALARDA